MLDNEKNAFLNASHSMINFIKFSEEIDNAYSPEQAKDLTSRLVNSIRGRDAKKFSRGIKKIIKESQRENNAD